MKKILTILLLLCFMLTGCSNNHNANATWDCVEYSTIEEMNEAAGTNIVSAGIAGKSDEWFGVISKSIAQYKFKANDEEWCVRASKDVDNDISGVYSDSIDFEKDITSTYYTDEIDLFRFFYNDVQYVITLDVKDKDISTAHFDSVCNEFKTNITGVKSGYENEIFEDGDDVIYRVTFFNDDGSTMVMDTVYSFKDDKMVSITSIIGFETEQAVQDYVDLLVEYGRSTDEFTVDGLKIISDGSSNVDFYSDYTKEGFIEMMKTSMIQ